MKILRSESIQVEKEIGFVCNKCGETYYHDMPGFCSTLGLTALAIGRFGSRYLADADYLFDMCDKCCVELFDSFKIRPEITYAFSDPQD